MEGMEVSRSGLMALAEENATISWQLKRSPSSKSTSLPAASSTGRNGRPVDSASSTLCKTSDAGSALRPGYWKYPRIMEIGQADAF